MEKTSDYDFYLPPELIAQTPLADRASSRLLKLDKQTGLVSHGYFRDVVDYLEPGDLLVLNETKVIPARLFGRLATGARIEFLLLEQKDDCYEVLVRPGRRAVPGKRVIFGEGELEAEILDICDDGKRLVRFIYDGIFEQVLDRLGEMPLPPYITEKLAEKDRYQTVYAKTPGSAAAPTAGLHFTPEVFAALEKKGVQTAKVLLHVGLGTFRPVKSEYIKDHQMHAEYFELSCETAELVNEAKDRGSRVIAVGSTSLRTLESCANEGKVIAGSGYTDIFITPGYKFQIVDGMITNFHLPQSTLIMLISALAKREYVLAAYNEAVKMGYRFFSFGDCCLIV